MVIFIKHGSDILDTFGHVCCPLTWVYLYHLMRADDINSTWIVPPNGAAIKGDPIQTSSVPILRPSKDRPGLCCPGRLEAQSTRNISVNSQQPQVTSAHRPLGKFAKPNFPAKIAHKRRTKGENRQKSRKLLKTKAFRRCLESRSSKPGQNGFNVLLNTASATH